MTDKDLCIETEEIQTDGKDTYYCHRYEPTPYEVLDELFTFYTPEKTDVFVDYGCGMGRLNFYIEKRYSLSSTGVEYSPVYYEKALENKKTYNGNKDKIHFVNCKAEDYLVSKNETVFYLERHTTFERMDEIAASDAIYKDRRERFCLYRITV